MILGILPSWRYQGIKVVLCIKVIVFGIFFYCGFVHKGRLCWEYLRNGWQHINRGLFLNRLFLILHYKFDLFRLANICFLVFHRMILIGLFMVLSYITLLFWNFMFDLRIRIICVIRDVIRGSFQGLRLIWRIMIEGLQILSAPFFCLVFGDDKQKHLNPVLLAIAKWNNPLSDFNVEWFLDVKVAILLTIKQLFQIWWLSNVCFSCRALIDKFCKISKHRALFISLLSLNELSIVTHWIVDT